ncbi:MAG: SPOR domain-containing protein [Chitinophagales bacterium]|nr:SPOR domain-containing protein [Chitinophagales bacterium]MDW8394550.1 SPOR domain-containing protein [Chitinophagales bacterium]
MRFICTLLLVVAGVAPCLAQQGNIKVHADSSVKKVIALYRAYVLLENETPGYRIQIAAASNRNQLMEAKVRFLTYFPEMANYLEYQAPQFRLRVGDFRTQTEAELALEDIRKIFPNAFIVMGKIRASRIEW